MAVKGEIIPDLEKQIIADIETTVKDAEKKINPLVFNIPNIKNWRNPLVIEHNGKTTVHGERNPNLAFINNKE